MGSTCDGDAYGKVGRPCAALLLEQTLNPGAVCVSSCATGADGSETGP
jgi:hypothetical protein